MSAAAARPAPNHGSYQDAYTQVQAQLPGKDQAWLQSWRQAGAEAFAQLGFPQPRAEDWKYTSFKPLLKHHFQQSFVDCRGLDLDDLGAAALPDLDCYRLVFVNGRYTRMLSNLRDTPAGLMVLPMSQAVDSQTELLQQHLGRYLATDHSGLSALNQSLFSDGALIHLGKNIRADKPIHLIFVAAVTQQASWHQLRNLIIAETGSQAQVIETYIAVGEATYCTNQVTECVLADNAELSHYSLQQEGAAGFHIANLHAEQARDSRFTSQAFCLGSRWARTDIRSNLQGAGAHCQLNGLYLLDKQQHCDYHTRIDHIAAHTSSGELYKGIASGRSRAVFNGQVHVHPGAQKTDAQQANHNLLLSPHAEVDTKPQLEIDADDVKCSHGATIGQLDQDMLFYLRARGISDADARGLLTYGFAAELLDSLALEAVREQVKGALQAYLPNNELIREIA